MALLLASASLHACAALSSTSASTRIPSATQQAYMPHEQIMFVHFSMCTFAQCEQDTACRTNPPSLFHPTALNVSQWIETAAALGATQVCLTARHTGGFALWPTKHGGYGVRQSPWRGGRGDIVLEFTTACRRFGISPCLYVIPAWDCSLYWESDGQPAAYLNRTLGMLGELLDVQTYGKIDRLWFDQYGWGDRGGDQRKNGTSPDGLWPQSWNTIINFVHAHSPGTAILPGPDGCLTFGEGGAGAYPVVSYVNDTRLCSYACPADAAAADSRLQLGCFQGAAYQPDPRGTHYVPYETTMSIQNPGDAWFWHPGHAFDSPAELFRRYLATVGRGAHWILNLPPNTTGLIPEAYVQSAALVGGAIRRSFGANSSLGSTTADDNVSGRCDALVVDVQATGGEFDAVVIREDLITGNGQAVLGYSLELEDCARPGQWAHVHLNSTLAGQTVGMRSIARLPVPASPNSSACAVRFRCTRAIGGAQAVVRLHSISLHKVHAPPE